MSGPAFSCVFRLLLAAVALAAALPACVLSPEAGDASEEDEENIDENEAALTGIFPRRCNPDVCDAVCSADLENGYGICIGAQCFCSELIVPDPPDDGGGPGGCSGSGDCGFNQSCEPSTGTCVDNPDPCDDPNYAQLHLCDCMPANPMCN